MTNNVAVPPAPTAPGNDRCTDCGTEVPVPVELHHDEADCFVVVLPIRHDSDVRAVGAGTASGAQLFDVLLDGEPLCTPLLVSQDDADAMVLDIEREIAIKKAIHDAPITAESVITSEAVDPDGAHEIRVDGTLVGEWGFSTVDEVLDGLESKLVDAQLGAWPRHDSNVLELAVIGGVTVSIDGRPLGQPNDHVWSVDHAPQLVDRAVDAIARRAQIHGLRELADFLEAHDDLPMPSSIGGSLYLYEDRAALEAAAGALDERVVELDASSSVTAIRVGRVFAGGVKLRYFGSRDLCTPAIVDGKVVYELPELPGRRIEATA